MVEVIAVATMEGSHFNCKSNKWDFLFVDLSQRPYLDPHSNLYALRGNVACPSSVTDESYATATETPTNDVAKLVLKTPEVDTLIFGVTEEQITWLRSLAGATLCWTMSSCLNDSLKNGSRPCTKKVGVLLWSGERLRDFRV